MNALLWPLAVIVLIVLLILIVVRLLRIKIQAVPQEERLIIYRWGRFHRVAGPGPVLIVHAFDSVTRTINVREQDRNFTVPGLFSFDIPFGYTLNLWYRYDPVVVAQGDDQLLLELAQHGGDERYAQIAVKLRNALVRAIMLVQKEEQDKKQQEKKEAKKKLLKSTVTLQQSSASIQIPEIKFSIIEKLMLIVPGLPTSDRILRMVEEELMETLPRIGVILNRSHPITVVGLDISEDLMRSFSRGRITELLRSTYPSLVDADLAHRAAMIEGLVESHSFDGGQAMQIQPELRQGRQGMETRVKARPPQHTAAASSAEHMDKGPYVEESPDAEQSQRPPAAERGAPKSATDPVAPQPTFTERPHQPDWQLSSSDLAVLKSVPSMPQTDGRQRKVG